MRTKTGKHASRLTLHFSLLLFALSPMPFALSQQYGWKNISANLPDFANDTLIINEGEDTLIAMIRGMHFLDDEEGWIILNNGLDSSYILHTANGGNNWELRSKHKIAFNAIHMRDQFMGYTGGQNGGIIYKTEDGGYTWNFHWTLGNTLAEIEFPPLPADTGYACGMNGSLMMITPAGGTPVDVNVNSDLHGLSFPVNGDQGWLSGWNIVRHYLNGTWYADQVHITGYHNDIEFIDNQTGWTCGDRIMHTEDGYNWADQVTGDQLDGDLFSISFANAETGCAVGTVGQVFFTTNGGDNWEKLDLGTTEHLIDVRMTSPTCGYITGHGKQIFKYTQVSGEEEQGGGEEWERGGVEVFPNPTRGKFQMTSTKHQTNSKFQTNSKNQIQNIEVVDLYGKVIDEIVWDLNFSAGLEFGACHLEFDLSSYPAGVYFIMINIDNEMIVKKIIKL